jgi:hypothetical protein
VQESAAVLTPLYGFWDEEYLWLKILIGMLPKL